MQITQARYLISSPDYEKCPPPDRPEYAFIGRSNVGKSSLINMITGNTKLAKTSNQPGKTQMINHFEIASKSENNSKMDRWYLVDLPGYGFAKISLRSRRKWEQMIENYLRNRPNLRQVFVLIDSRHTPQKIDLDFIKLLATWQIPYSLFFTKADKEKQAIVSKNVKSFLNALLTFQQFLPLHIVTSSAKQLGRNKALKLIEELNEDD